MAKDNDGIGIVKGEGTQQHAVDDAEDGGVGADREGHGENRDRREARRAAEQPSRIAEVLKQRGNHQRAPFGRGERGVERRQRLRPALAPYEPNQRGDLANDHGSRGERAAPPGVADELVEEQPHLVAVAVTRRLRQQPEDRPIDRPGHHASFLTPFAG